MPLTRYKISQDGQFFEGRIELPLSVGTKGGAFETNPSYINTHSILGFPTSVELAQIMASVGLAQNLAAIRALSVEGIQRGHMNLHAKNVAIQAGVPSENVTEVVEFMKMRNQINTKAAQLYMKSKDLFKMNQTRSKTQQRELSSFYVEIKKDSLLPEPLLLTILLDCKTGSHQQKAFHLAIEKGAKLTNEEASLLKYLIGKDYDWIASFLSLMQSIAYTKRVPVKKDMVLSQCRFKLLTILANVLTTHLLQFDGEATTGFVRVLVSNLDRWQTDKSKKTQDQAYSEIRSCIPEA